jgi:hypothetical protein
MSQPHDQTAVRIPRWLVWVGSIAVVFHLGAVGVHALAVQSGPWADNDGMPIASPLLASRMNEMIGADYLRYLRLGLVYHEYANKNPAWPGVYLEFRLKDKEGKDIKTVRIPDEDANWAVRHRQAMLTLVFGDDRQITPRQTEMIPAPGQTVPVYQVWEMEKGQLRIQKMDENRIPRDHPVFGPTEAMFVLAQSYSRYLCETHGAAKAELIRHFQRPIRPYVLTEDVPARAFDEIISNFGEFPP